MKKTKNIIWIIALILVIILIGAIAFGYYKNATNEVKNPVATMEVEGFGTVKIELYPDKAPQTVSNFITLANGGDKQGTGSGAATLADLKDDGSDTEYSIKGEFISNGVDNKLKFDEGVVGMARNDYTQQSSSLKEESYNSGSSQFFIMTKNNTSLNGYYTAFGKVIEGMDVVHNIEQVEVKASEDSKESSSSQQEVSTPVNPVKITSIRVETNGVDYGLPETLTPFNYSTWLYKQYGIDPSSLSTEQ